MLVIGVKNRIIYYADVNTTKLCKYKFDNIVKYFLDSNFNIKSYKILSIKKFHYEKIDLNSICKIHIK